ncbi:NEDD8 activating enzyme [Moesziomyces antarcticus]|uniref:Related to ubiquitin-activating enzyme n=2 Tax=Pseudozyma antarctica TaxID=84753 RepID=A0A5C3FWL6_PSEA2|nr:NEDD8 activating enzyme [Moesziomyces antarcticus]GAK67464.1 NEDD8 activating enzyme [Moesziomyces antarcticus]SPO48722.1 related to ubiquitin-activating enzyme [Moesziomyces antarcticus]
MLHSPARYQHVDRLLDRPGPATDAAFQAGASVKHFLRTQCKILVIGAGGLGCEILANLALSGFHHIHIIDMDTIDVSNLNRQFLFREADVGRPKAEVAAEFVRRRVPGVDITPYHGKIQDKDEQYYMQFNLIICGLDSVEARRWINATLVNMVDDEDPDSLKPLIDGGTEGFKGQARVILPTVTSCYECSLDMLSRQTTYPICTIANTPRLPEHCIEWASVLEWPRLFPDTKLDNDNPDHIQWLYDQAAARADSFGITGVTWGLTQGVVKNIIPAIASTNAIVAAACVLEAFKIATTAAPFLNNYMMVTGNDSVYTYTFEHEKRPDCPVCGGESRTMTFKQHETVQDLIDRLGEMPDLQLTKPSLAIQGRPLYFQAPKQIEEATRPNLGKRIAEVCAGDDEVTVTDARLPFTLGVVVKFDG